MNTNIRFLGAIIGLFLLCGAFASDLTAAGTTARIDVLLVSAGNGDGGVDPALKPYAGTLQRLFRFKSYNLVKKTGMKVDLPGGGSTSLPDGQSLKVNAKPSGDRTINADIEWMRGGKRLLHTGMQLRPGKPAVLGGPRSGEGTLLLILVVR